VTFEARTAEDVVELLTGGWRAQAVYTAVRLGLPDLIEAGRASSGELASATGTKEEGIRRLMRLLVAMGVFSGTERTGYRNTLISTALLDRPESLRDMCLLYGEEFYTAWGRACDAISTLTAGFELAYGQPLYAYLSQDSDASDRFQRAMRAGNLFFDHVPKIFDFSGGKHIVDVGGGNGHLIAAILTAVADARATLLDREHVVPLAKEYLAATVGLDRIDVVGGSMFDGVPAGGDVYLLCRVLAGWDDNAVVGVFENCRRAMAAGPAARLLILDRVVVDEGSTVLPALWDLHLLMTNGGRHRTIDTFRRLLDRAGLDLERVADLPVETTAMVAVPRPGAVSA
jgi:hypothetical protein